MFLSIDYQSDLPIYHQITRQVKFAIAAGTLRAGQLVPSARALSQQLTINPNTVVKAFSLLQSDGIIEPLRGRGMVVSAGAIRICKKHREKELGQRIGESVAEAWHAGLSQSDIETIVQKHLSGLVKTEPTVTKSSVADPSVTDPPVTDPPVTGASDSA